MDNLDENQSQQAAPKSEEVAASPAGAIPAPENQESDGFVDEGPEPIGPAGQRAPRVFIRETIVRQLVKGGVPNDIASVTKAVNEILEYAITSHQAEMINMADVVAIEQGLADRIEELTAVNIALAKLLYDLGAVIEVDRIFGSFKAIAKSRVPGSAVATTGPEPKPVVSFK